ncbi:MAG: NAD(P)/FAD-dependent oxidoreductase [bacterium]|nr:NAD(P)/FAD-dependent oxidoreductase [bacterium]
MPSANPAADSDRPRRLHFDAIVIGSGMSSMATASLLSRLRGQRVLMLEQHYIMGGFTHEFSRMHKGRRFHWDVGVHYIGDMQPDSILRKIFDRVTGGGVEWAPMPRERFERFVYPDLSIDVPADEIEYRRVLIERFPDEQNAIDQYFRDIKKINAWFGQHFMKSGSAFIDRARAPLRINNFRSVDISTAEYMDRNFSDPRLKAVLTSRWPDYGVPPSRSSFLVHATVDCHYLAGGYFPVGGAGAIAAAIRPLIEAPGGEIRLAHRVEEILVADGRAVGVRARNLRARKSQGDEELVEAFAPVIISGAGVYNTYERMLPASVDVAFRAALRDFYLRERPASAVTAYCALKVDPREAGFEFQGENHWFYCDYDADRVFANGVDWLAGRTDLRWAYLSFPSLKNPQAKHHTAEIIVIADDQAFAPWRDTTSWKRRTPDYEKLKDKIAGDLLALIEARHPGFAEIVERVEVSTPLSVEHFSRHPAGAVYGLPCVPERFRSKESPWCAIASPVLPGLYLTGVDVCPSGVGGALLSAIGTTMQLPAKLGFGEVLRAGAAVSGKATL